MLCLWASLPQMSIIDDKAMDSAHWKRDGFRVNRTGLNDAERRRIVNDSGRVVYVNGQFVPESEARISIYDSALMFGRYGL